MKGFSTLFFLFVIFISNYVAAQDHMLIFRKGGKTVKTYFVGEYIAFMDHSKQWHYGILNKMNADSFYIKPYALRPVVFDTISYPIEEYAVKNILAMPKPGVVINDILEPGNGQVRTNAGHVKFYWLKAGAIFRIAGLGLAGLDFANSFVLNYQSFSWAEMGYSAALFVFGELLKFTYKPYVKLGRKYMLKMY
jgi:hypothetical protein